MDASLILSCYIITTKNGKVFFNSVFGEFVDAEVFLIGSPATRSLILIL